jgi:hypothetical protein
MAEISPVRSSTPEVELTFIKFVGGTNAVTKVEGEGVTVTYVSAGIVDLVFGAAPGPAAGEFLGIVGHCFVATTTADVDTFTLQHGVYNTSTRTLRFNMSEAGTLANLAALEWLNILVAFKKATV